MKRIYIYMLVLILSLMGVAACSSQTAVPEFKGTLLPTPIPAPDITLTQAGEQPVSLSDFEGKVVLLYFGYTFCPDICPMTMTDLAQVQRVVDDAGEEVQVIMITVDPERDTPETLAKYVNHFHPSFIGLSGTPEQIAEAAQGFGVFYEAHEGTPATGYLVDHTARVFVVDQEGMYRLSFPYETPSEDMIADLRTLLARLG